MIFKWSTCDFLEQATEDRLEEQIQFTDKETETSPFDSGQPLWFPGGSGWEKQREIEAENCLLANLFIQ